MRSASQIDGESALKGRSFTGRQITGGPSLQSKNRRMWYKIVEFSGKNTEYNHEESDQDAHPKSGTDHMCCRLKWQFLRGNWGSGSSPFMVDGAECRRSVCIDAIIAIQ